MRSPAIRQGHFTFGAADHQPGPEHRISLQGNGFASMLLGWGNGSQLSTSIPKAFSRAGYWGFFVPGRLEDHAAS